MNKIRTYRDAVQIMVNWWVEKSFNTPLNQNNGDESANGAFAFAFANLASMRSQEQITPEKIEKFKERLTKDLLTAEKGTRWDRECSVDYNPNRILADACAYAGINTLCLPCKTFTYIDDENVINGRYQYGGAWFKI